MKAQETNNFAVVQDRPRDRGYSRHSIRPSGSIIHQLARCSLAKLQLFANRTVTDCRATASGCPAAKRLPYKMIREASLCAFFERSRFTAQIGENFAREMQRASDQDRIWLLTRKHQCVVNG